MLWPEKPALLGLLSVILGRSVSFWVVNGSFWLVLGVILADSVVL